jgi:hypothetical protein
MAHALGDFGSEVDSVGAGRSDIGVLHAGALVPTAMRPERMSTGPFGFGLGGGGVAHRGSDGIAQHFQVP